MRLGRAALVAFAASGIAAIDCGGQVTGSSTEEGGASGGTDFGGSGGVISAGGNVGNGGRAATGGKASRGGSGVGGAGGFLSFPPYGLPPPPPVLDSGVSSGGAATENDGGFDCIDLFSGGTAARCCPNPAPDCSNKPDGYPGYSCVPPPQSFCSCHCQSGVWACAC